MITYDEQLNFAKLFGESLFYGASYPQRPAHVVRRIKFRFRAAFSAHVDHLDVPGADCMLMLAVFHIQLTSRHLLPTHKILLYISDLIFLLVTAHFTLLLYETFSGTVPPRVLQAAVAVAQIELALGDFVLVWRVWVVWSRDWRVVVLPALTLLAGLAVGLASAVEAVSYNALSKILPVPGVIMAVINNGLCTILIVARLAYLDALINGHLAFGAGRDKTYRGVILMMVESGAVLTIVNVISLVLERLRHPGLHVVLNILVPLASIVPTSIIVLSYLKLSPGDTVMETITVRFASRFEDSAVGAGRPRDQRRRGPDLAELTVISSRGSTCASDVSSVRFSVDMDAEKGFGTTCASDASSLSATAQKLSPCEVPSRWAYRSSASCSTMVQVPEEPDC
ncbi:hypothetical protein OH76DRAFT_1018249 [Lentinus brumalis]|uniref:Uncharacterized protein n=1 Tax=Lentinus brumalis TaxID=2498619 RepID=A0A371CY47_9APHY|nr:hypothetical protein OH76DRAFT_1018249 [Polyporus brumalis]